jgi:hypothetical protein
VGDTVIVGNLQRLSPKVLVQPQEQTTAAMQKASFRLARSKAERRRIGLSTRLTVPVPSSQTMQTLRARSQLIEKRLCLT